MQAAYLESFGGQKNPWICPTQVDALILLRAVRKPGVSLERGYGCIAAGKAVDMWLLLV